MEERLLALLRLLIKYGGTDIHFLLKGVTMTIEMRINNEMRRVKTKYNDDKLIRYLQYLADLELGKQLEPQTGHFDLKVDGKLLNSRFAVINGSNYCNAVLRVLNNEPMIELDSILSIEDQNLHFKKVFKKQKGLIVISGPIGSGKTTLVYTLLKSRRGDKIYTLEDPVEYYCDDFIQLQQNNEIGFDSEAGIKQILRHDPDVIFIGEIRDSNAAKMAVTAASTGHLVVTTIHASSAPSAIDRFIELGVDKERLLDVLISVSNQRLLFNTKTGNKQAFFEIMDEKEIKYFNEHGKHSKKFFSLSKQLESKEVKKSYELAKGY